MTTTKLGLPCWDKRNVPKAISSTAQMDVRQIDYFLASHAPIRHIRHDDTLEVLTEETFFEAIMKPTYGEVLALVHGDPGTGKSHLIHWLKLRCEDALRREEIKDFVPILIQRRSGTLKDALEQMISQLPQHFERYLNPVEEALSRLSDASARIKLAHMFSLELSAQQRKDRKRPSLPKDLTTLPEICGGSTGFRTWLCRDGSVIDQNIKRLTQARIEIEPDEQLPQFTAREFKIDPAYTVQNTPKVIELIDEFLDDPKLRERAAELFNEVSSDAIREMTGLSGNRLRTIFDQIRIDLKAQNKQLGLFIEDLSVMSTLNEEVLVAIEPQGRPELCKMVAVVGTTNQGWNRLPDNQRERVTHPVSVGGVMTDEWRRNAKEVAEFAGRYLNATRLSSDDVTAVAKQRRRSGDLNISACDICPVRDDCHATFGKIQIDNVEIGMYPLTTIAPKRLLNHLSEHAAVHKNPRGLLTRILHPVLDDGYDYLESNIFPPVKKFAVSLPELTYWAAFEESYCGSWKAEDKTRLKLLAQGWIEADDVDEAAIKLSPLLKPLGFREFARGVPTELEQPPEEPRVVQPSQPVQRSSKLNEILANLGKWIEGETLVGDREIRQLLAEFVRRSVPWDDYSYPPLEVWKTLIGDATQYEFIRIEGMHAITTRSKVAIEFSRSAETRDLIEALAQFRHSGGRSWKFPHSEVHKRRLAQWLRRHHTRLIRQLQPQDGLDPSVPVMTATQFLALNALVRRRAKLPPEPQQAPDLLESLLTDEQMDAAETLSKEWRQLLDDMRLKQPLMKKFILSELDIPQGRTARGINFINPMPILKSATDFIKQTKVTVPSSDFNKSFWEGRYEVFERMDSYSRLFDIVKLEQEAIDDILKSIKWTLDAAGYDTAELPTALLIYCKDLGNIIAAQKTADIPVPDAAFDELRNRKVFVERADLWASALKQAQTIVNSNDPVHVIIFDPKLLKEVQHSIAVATSYLTRVEKLVNEMLQHIEQEGDPDTLANSILKTLEDIANQPDAALKEAKVI
jgi:hypothetical protein